MKTPTQLSIAELEYASKKRLTRRENSWQKWNKWCRGRNRSLNGNRIIHKAVAAAGNRRR